MGCYQLKLNLFQNHSMQMVLTVLEQEQQQIVASVGRLPALCDDLDAELQRADS